MRHRRPETLALIVALSSTLAVLTVFLIDLALSRQRDLQLGEKRLQQFTVMLAEHTARAFEAVDVLVMTPFPLQAGVVVPCRALGILKMEDEGGVDGKVLAVPTAKICPQYNHINKLEDLNPLTLQTISHFFEHYKDLEKGKWVKVLGWEGLEAATKEVTDGVANYKG